MPDKKQTLTEYLKYRDNPATSFKAFKELREQVLLALGQLENIKNEMLIARSSPIQAFEDIEKRMAEEVQGVKKDIKVIEGPPGPKPIAGIDYPIPKDGKTPTIEEIKALIPLPLKGDAGYTPVKGRDYFDGEDGRNAPTLEEILIKIPKPEDGKDGSPDTPEEIAGKINTLEEIIEQKTIKGLSVFLKNLQRAIREKVVGGGGVGNPQHETFAISASTTAVTLNFAIAAGGHAIFKAAYQGQELHKDVHFTVGTNLRTGRFPSLAQIERDRAKLTKSPPAAGRKDLDFAGQDSSAGSIPVSRLIV